MRRIFHSRTFFLRVLLLQNALVYVMNTNFVYFITLLFSIVFLFFLKFEGIFESFPYFLLFFAIFAASLSFFLFFFPYLEKWKNIETNHQTFRSKEVILLAASSLCNISTRWSFHLIPTGLEFYQRQGRVTSLFRDKRAQRRSREPRIACATRSLHRLIRPKNNAKNDKTKKTNAIFKKSASPLFLTYLGHCSTQFPLLSYQSNFSLRNKEFHISKKISSRFHHSHRETQAIPFNDE